MGNHLAGDVAKKVNRHMPTILTALSGVGLAATAYLFARAGAKTAVANEREEVSRSIPMSMDEKFQANWQEYVIPTSVGIATLVCLTSANVLNTQRQATLMGAYALGERTWAKYRGKVAEMIGVENETTIREETVKDVAAERKVGSKVYGDGDTIYFDVFSGQMFRSDEETIRKAMELTNERANEDGFVNINYFYDQIGARTTQFGEQMGWSDGFPLDVVLTPVRFEDGTDGFGLDYARYPFWGYHEV